MIFFHIKRVTHTHTKVKGGKQIKSSKLVILQLAREMGESNHFYYIVISQVFLLVIQGKPSITL